MFPDSIIKVYVSAVIWNCSIFNGISLKYSVTFSLTFCNVEI